MNLVTITIDLDTHVVMPIEPTWEQIKQACDAWIDSTSRMLLNKACAAIKAGIKAAPPYQSEQVLNMVWIPCRERLPEMFQQVIASMSAYVNGRRHAPVIVRYTNSYKAQINCFLLDGTELDSGVVTHWMPIPSAPKGEE